jgi:hypothetical protein
MKFGAAKLRIMVKVDNFKLLLTEGQMKKTNNKKGAIRRHL